MLHLLHEAKEKNSEIEFGDPVDPDFERVQRERELLSRFAHDPTVGGLRDKKEKRSTQSRLRVDPGFASF